MNELEIKWLNLNLSAVFTRLIADVPHFEVLDANILPYGLKRHTRSISWLAEQVILQNIKKRKSEYGLTDFQDPISDTSAWDARLDFVNVPAFVNVKITEVTRPAAYNDIASVKKLLKFYKSDPTTHLFYVVVPVEFDKNRIIFRGSPIVRYYPWMDGFIVNSRNHHIQALYESKTVERTTDDFLNLLTIEATKRNVV